MVESKGMFRSVLQIALRVFLRKRAYTIINLGGLSIGLAAAFLVALVLRHEFTYDQFHPKANQIYRLAGVRSYGFFPTLPIYYSDLIKAGEFPEIHDFVRMRRWPAKYVTTESKKVFNEKVLFTDPGSSFFKVFGIELIEGTPNEVLTREGSIVLSESFAEILYQRTTIVGEILTYDTMSLTVTGVMRDLPSNSHLTAHAIITNEKAMAVASGAFTYCVVGEGADLKALTAKLLARPPSREGQDKLKEILPQSLKDIHFGSAATYELKPPGNLMYLLLFSSIGAIVLLIAISNYVNLSVAMYVERAKEIAVRMVMGVKPAWLAAQVLTETLVVSLLSLPFSIAMVDVALPWINSMMQINLGPTVFSEPVNLIFLFLITLTVGLLAGLFPALTVPRFGALALFKKTIANVGGITMRKRMVSIQFILLALLGGSAWMIERQLNFMQDMPLGFNQDQVLKITNAWSLDSTAFSHLKNALLQHPSVSHVSHGIAPGDEDYGFPFKTPGSEEIHQDLIVTVSDFEFIPTLDLQIQECQLDWSNLPGRMVLINETLARRLGHKPEDGTKIIVNPGAPSQRERIVDGVFSDIHFRSLREKVGPHMLVLRRSGSFVNQNVLVRLQGGVSQEFLAFVQGELIKIAPDTPMQVEFLSEDIQRAYTNERNLAMLTVALVVIACITSLMGLVGFVSYLIEMRTKEIGIRTILGASPIEIISQLGRPLLVVVAITSLAGAAGAYLLSEYWLQNFAYQTRLDFLPFVLVVLASVCMALSIVAWKGYQASLSNPVNALRYE